MKAPAFEGQFKPETVEVMRELELREKLRLDEYLDPQEQLEWAKKYFRTSLHWLEEHPPQEFYQFDKSERLIDRTEKRFAALRNFFSEQTGLTDFPPQSYFEFHKNLDPNKKPEYLRKLFFYERLGFVPAFLPKAAFLQYKTAIVKRVINNHLTSSLENERALIQENHYDLKHLAFWLGQLSAIMADFGHNLEFKDYAKTFWQFLNGEISQITGLAKYHHEQNMPNIISPKIKKMPEEALSVDSPQTITAELKSGVAAQAYIINCCEDNGLAASTPPPKWDSSHKVDLFAYDQQDGPKAGCLAMQIKGLADNIALSPKLINLALVNLQEEIEKPRLLHSQQDAKAAIKLIQATKQFSKQYQIPMKFAWLEVPTARLDRNTGSVVVFDSSHSPTYEYGEEIAHFFHQEV